MQLTRQGSPTKLQAVKIANARLEGVLVATDGDLGAVIHREEGAVKSVPGTEAIIALAWVKCQRRCAGLCHVFEIRKDACRGMTH